MAEFNSVNSLVNSLIFFYRWRTIQTPGDASNVGLQNQSDKKCQQNERVHQRRFIRHFRSDAMVLDLDFFHNDFIFQLNEIFSHFFNWMLLIFFLVC